MEVGDIVRTKCDLEASDPTHNKIFIPKGSLGKVYEVEWSFRSAAKHIKSLIVELLDYDSISLYEFAYQFKNCNRGIRKCDSCKHKFRCWTD